MRTLPLGTLLFATIPLLSACSSSGTDPGSGSGGTTSSSSGATTAGAGGTSDASSATTGSSSSGAGGAEVDPSGTFVAVGYGGRQAIADAVKSLLRDAADTGADMAEVIENLTVDAIEEHLYQEGLATAAPATTRIPQGEAVWSATLVAALLVGEAIR